MIFFYFYSLLLHFICGYMILLYFYILCCIIFMPNLSECFCDTGDIYNIGKFHGCLVCFQSNTFDPKHNSLPTQRPPATLTATCRADIFLLVSPLVPTSYFGVLMAASQRRGYQIRGIKRLRLTQKMAGSLGKNFLHCHCFKVSKSFGGI